MWLLFAFLSGLFYTGQGLITRSVLKANQDAWAFSFFFSFIGALVSLPFMLVDFKIATELHMWALLLGVGFLIVLQNLLNFKSSHHIEASVNGSITKFRLVWTFLFGVIFLHEMFTWSKLIGTVLTIAAGLIIIRKFKQPKSLRGVMFAFSATLVYGIVIILYKFLFASFSAASLTFFIFAIPALINIFLMPNAISRITKILRTTGKMVIVACALGAFANLALNQALAIGEVSRVIVIVEAFLVFTLVGEHLWLKEKTELVTKIIAVVLATVGAIIIRS